MLCKKMNREEAKKIVEQELEAFREMSCFELSKRIGTGPVSIEMSGPSGQSYQVEIQVFWDDKPYGDIRVSGSIDDGGWRAFVPLTCDFIKNSRGEFVDE